MGNNPRRCFHSLWVGDTTIGCWLGEQLVGSTAVEFLCMLWYHPSVLRHAPLDILIYMARDCMICSCSVGPQGLSLSSRCCFGGRDLFCLKKLANTSSYTHKTHKIVSNKDSIDEDDDHHSPSWWWWFFLHIPQMTQLTMGLFNDDDQGFVHLLHMLNTQLALRDWSMMTYCDETLYLPKKKNHTHTHTIVSKYGLMMARSLDTLPYKLGLWIDDNWIGSYWWDSYTHLVQGLPMIWILCS
jgi:hypothetical protein